MASISKKPLCWRAPPARGEGTCLHVSQDRKLQLTGTQNINDQELVIVMCVALHDLSLWLL